MARSEPKARPDVRVVELFLRTIGGGIGLYNPHSQSWREDTTTHALYQANLEIVRARLKEGWTAAELEETIRSRYKAGDRAALLAQVLPDKSESRRLEEHDNLLERGECYQHPALTERTMPVFTCDGHTMTLTVPGKVAPKTTFTLGELIRYYAQAMPEALPASPGSAPQVLGPFRFLLNAGRVDEVLTAIDLAREEDARTPILDLARHLPLARDLVRERAARAKELFV